MRWIGGVFVRGQVTLRKVSATLIVVVPVAADAISVMTSPAVTAAPVTCPVMVKVADPPVRVRVVPIWTPFLNAATDVVVVKGFVQFTDIVIVASDFD